MTKISSFLFNTLNNIERQKIMNTKSTTQFLKGLILLFTTLTIAGCGPNLEDKTYNLFYRFCKNIDFTQMNQVIQIFGESQFNSWCSCASHKTEDVIPTKKQFQILSKEVGMVDPDYEKFQYTAINSFGECIASFPAGDDRTRNLIKNLSEYMKAKAIGESGSYGLSQSNSRKLNSSDAPNLNSSDAPNLNSSDENKISSIIKNGIDGWGFTQEAWLEEGDVLLLLNPNEKNSFRKISFYNCVPDQGYQKIKNTTEVCKGKKSYYKKITGEKIIPMAEAFKNMSLREEADPYFKKAPHYEEKLSLKKQGWSFVRYYYENANKCSSNAYVLDYYSASVNKIRKVTYCNGVKTEQILDPYIAEQIYVKSGMSKGD
jgi:hypothetical protein